MSETPAASPAPEVRAEIHGGQVIDRAWALLKLHPTSIVVLAIVFAGVPGAVGTWIQAEASGWWLRTAGLADGSFIWVSIGLSLARGIFAFGCLYLVQAAVAQLAAGRLDGGARPLRAIMTATLRRAGQLFVSASIVYVGILAAALMLLVPGAWLSARWAVVAPAVALEGRGVGDSLVRAAALTKGDRLVIFLLGLAYVVGLGATNFGLRALLTVFAAQFGSTTGSWIWMAASALTTVVSAIIVSTVVTAIYLELLGLKEGAGPSVTAAVFD